MRFALFAALLTAFSATGARALPTAAQIQTAFSAIDSTGNGAISAVEWDAVSFALFRAADKDNNNFIDATELQGSSLAQDTFLRADSDRDGRLSVGEFMALRRVVFRLSDIDRDDSLSFVEYELFLVLEQVGWVDRNHSDHIELSELAESLRKVFDLLDTDRDGRLSSAEAAHLQPDAFRKFDTAVDGQLTSAEFVAGYRTALLSP